VAASAVWTAEDYLQLTLRYYETPFYRTITCTFSGDQVSLAVQTNISFYPTQENPLFGRMG
jgi:hypothetical protein